MPSVTRATMPNRVTVIVAGLASMLIIRVLLASCRAGSTHNDYRTPVKNLYLCGSGAHPGGGVTGAPGHNCAREVLRDFGRRFPGQ